MEDVKRYHEDIQRYLKYPGHLLKVPKNLLGSCCDAGTNRVLGDEAPQFDQFLQLYGKVVHLHVNL